MTSSSVRWFVLPVLALSLSLSLGIAESVAALPPGMPQLLDFDGDVSEHCPRPEPTNISYFGGTAWDPVDARWEALADSVWTFDTGVASNFGPSPTSDKVPGLHGLMEGWSGVDLRFSYESYFRRISSADVRWSGTPCVGSPAGLGGVYSMWAGVFADEAEQLHFHQGQGYGNRWKLLMQKTFSSSGGSAVMQFDYKNNTEAGKDFTRVLLWNGTPCDGSPTVLQTYTGSQSGHESLNFTVPLGTWTLAFEVSTDDDGSAEDCGFAGPCGAFAVDNIQIDVMGMPVESQNFETTSGGWTVGSCPGEDYSNIMSLGDLPPFINECGTCALQDTVLLFGDPFNVNHAPDQDNIALSPWIDLQAAGLNELPGKFIEFDTYVELPVLNYVFIQVAADYLPNSNPFTGGPALPHPVLDLPRYYTEGAFCTQGTPLRVDLSHLIDHSAQAIRVGVGVVNLCQFYPDCTQSSNYTPYFDNIRVGVYGDPQLPALAAHAVDLPQDSFPADGSLAWSSPGRVDCALVLSDQNPRPQPATATGDTLVVRGAFDDAEVRVVFAVRPGPYLDTGGPGHINFLQWLGQFAFEGTHYGLDWYSAGMDTAEIGGCLYPGVWMTAFREGEPQFIGTDTDTDPNDLDPLGNQSRLRNDIFPDNLFTPGTRLMLFYKARRTGAGTWTTEPDTSGGCVYEMEVLPSSMDSTGTFNSVLYVDDADGFGAQPLIEQGLATVLPGGSTNFEGTVWDRYDVGASSSGNVALGRPNQSRYGANATQLAGYQSIVFNSGDLPGFTLTPIDASTFTTQLTTLGGNVYVSGDNVAEDLTPNPAFLNGTLGTVKLSNNFRYAGFPVTDFTNCVELNPIGTGAGAHFDGNIGDAAAAGNGCPQVRRFDVLGTADPNAAGNEDYVTPVSGTVSYHSVSFDPGTYRTVLDGASLAERRDDALCTSTAPIADRLCHVLGWFSTPGLIAGCADTSAVDTTASLSGVKFHDLNANGVRDPGEPGLGGIQIRAVAGDGTVVGTAVTAGDGSYTIDNIAPGPDFWISETVPAGMVQTAPSTVVYRMPLAASQIVPNLDFGNRDSCDAQAYASFTAGVDDNFSLANGPEWFYPGVNGLRSFCVQADSLKADTCVVNLCIGHTFSNLVPPGCHIQSAIFTIRLKACGDSPGNDTFSFNEAGQLPAWHIAIHDLRQALNGEPNSWNPGETTLLVMDLANLPPSQWGITNVLGALQDGEMSAFVQDDTSVDFMRLEIQYCCDAGTFTCARPPRGMAGWWPGDSGLPSAVDLVVPHRNGVLNGDATYAPGAVGSGFLFDGNGDYVAVPHAAKLYTPNQLTVDCWVLTSDTRNGPRTIVRKVAGFGNLPGFWLFLDGGNLFVQAGSFSIGTIHMIADGTWHHLALTLSRANLDLYLDGTLINGYLYTPPQATLANTEPLYIGGGGGFDLDGRIDEVEYFCRKLGAPEIQSIVDAGPEGKCREGRYLADVSRGYPGDVIFVSPKISNFSPKPRTYVWEVVPLPAGGECTVAGPSQITPSSGTVTISPGTCASVGPVAITPPAGMQQDDQACYEFHAYHEDDTSQTIVVSAQGRLRKKRPDWKIADDHDATAGYVMPVFPDPATSDWDTVEVRFRVENEKDPSELFEYRLHLKGADPDTASDEVAFLGLAPGDSISGSEAILVGDKKMITAKVRYPACQPFNPRRVVLSQNAVDEGGYVPVAEVGIGTGDAYALVGLGDPGTDPVPVLSILQASPNPFRASTDIAFQLGRGGPVDLSVYDVAGRVVRRLYQGRLEAGPQRFVWDARDDAGRGVGSGLYFIRLGAQTVNASRKVLLLR